ncbi:MAG: hypothetical protein JKY60_12470 [Kordiimonadaceae bacterium]|nr:hypothetical protein [Kordiimonadaceae bacterium]
MPTNSKLALACLTALVLTFGEPLKALERSHQNPRVAFFDSFPFYFKNSKGEPDGFSYRAVELTLGKLDVGYDYSAMPLGRLFRQVGSGIQDLTVVYKLPALLPDLHFIATFGCLQITLAPVKGSGIQGFADLTGKRVVYPVGGRFARLYASSLDIIGMPVAKVKNIFGMAIIGGADAVVFNNMAFESSRLFGPDEGGASADVLMKFGDPVPLLEMELAIAISRNSKFDPLIPRIASQVKKARKAGAYQALFRRFGETSGGQCKADAALAVNPK